MSCEHCGMDLCVCAERVPSRFPVPYKPHVSQPPGITKEEFGLNLYETITTIGGIMGLEQQRAAAIHYEHPEKIPDLLRRRKALQITLAAQLPKLKNHELDEILVRYPWVVSC